MPSTIPEPGVDTGEGYDHLNSQITQNDLRGGQKFQNQKQNKNMSSS